MLGSGEGLFDKPAGGSWARKLFLLKMFSHKPLQISTKSDPPPSPVCRFWTGGLRRGCRESADCTPAQMFLRVTLSWLCNEIRRFCKCKKVTDGVSFALRMQGWGSLLCPYSASIHLSALMKVEIFEQVEAWRKSGTMFLMQLLQLGLLQP